jgi:signal transduction histidine kinase
MDLREICQTLSREIQKLVPYDRLAINLPQKSGNAFAVYAEESRLPAPAIPAGFSIGEGTATGWLVRNREIVLCEDVLRDDRFPLTHKRYREVGIRSYVIFPLMVKGKVVGALNLGSLKPGFFGKKEIGILSPIAEVLSLAVENSNLYEEAKKREETQQLLKELSQDITSLGIDRLLTKLTAKVREAFGVDISDVRVREKNVWKVMGISGIEADRVRSGVTGSARGRSSWIIKNRRALSIPDITKAEGEDIPTGERTAQLGIRGYLGVPLFSRGGEVIGVLRAMTYQPREFTQEEADLLQQLANGAAIALENAHLFEEVQKKSTELAEAFRTKSAFLNTIAHELKTSLHVIMGTEQLLSDGTYGAVTEEQKQALDRIERNVRDVLALIEEILQLARLETRRVPIHIEEFPAGELVEELQSSFDPLVREKGLGLKIDLAAPQLRLQSDKAKVKMILQNLLSNAIKYTDRGGVDVRVRRREHENPRRAQISFSVGDTGIGIKEEDGKRIFEPFYMAGGVDRKQRPGTGLGLTIVKRLVELLDGEILVESEWGKGSTFTVTLPLVHGVES